MDDKTAAFIAEIRRQDWEDYDELPPEARKLVSESDISSRCLRDQFEKVGDWNLAFQLEEEKRKKLNERVAHLLQQRRMEEAARRVLGIRRRI
jgi:hypothetical protein